MSGYGYDAPTQIQGSGNYLPFVRVDIISLESAYLQQYYPKDIQAVDTDDPDASFKRLIEQRRSISHWQAYERRALHTEVVRWCKENHVAYL